MKVGSGAMCAKHGDVAAVDICSRCGAFVCAGCEELSVRDEVFCTPCFERVNRKKSLLARLLASFRK